MGCASVVNLLALKREEAGGDKALLLRMCVLVQSSIYVDGSLGGHLFTNEFCLKISL